MRRDAVALRQLEPHREETVLGRIPIEDRALCARRKNSWGLLPLDFCRYHKRVVHRLGHRHDALLSRGTGWSRGAGWPDARLSFVGRAGLVTGASLALRACRKDWARREGTGCESRDEVTEHMACARKSVQKKSNFSQST